MKSSSHNNKCRGEAPPNRNGFINALGKLKLKQNHRDQYPPSSSSGSTQRNQDNNTTQDDVVSLLDRRQSSSNQNLLITPSADTTRELLTIEDSSFLCSETCNNNTDADSIPSRKARQRKNRNNSKDKKRRILVSTLFFRMRQRRHRRQHQKKKKKQQQQQYHDLLLQWPNQSTLLTEDVTGRHQRRSIRNMNCRCFRNKKRQEWIAPKEVPLELLSDEVISHRARELEFNTCIVDDKEFPQIIFFNDLDGIDGDITSLREDGREDNDDDGSYNNEHYFTPLDPWEDPISTS